MIELKLQRPFIDENGEARESLERHYAEDKYVDGYVYNNSVYNEKELLTYKNIEPNIKIIDILTGKVFKVENNLLIEDKINKYKIKQIETGIMYDEAVDLYPCKYNYEATEELVDILIHEEVLDE